MSALAVERRRQQARDAARLPDQVRADPVCVWHLMAALAHVNPIAREIWVDHRLVGMAQADIADRDRVSRARVGQRVRVCDGAIRAYLDARAM